MPILYIIAAIAGLAAIYFWPRQAQWSIHGLLILLVSPVALIMVQQPITTMIGLRMLGLGFLLTSVYALVKAGLSSEKRFILLFTSSVTLLTVSFTTLHLPGAGILGLVCAINVGLYAYVMLRRRAAYRMELGILTIIAAESLIRLIQSVFWLMP